MLEALKKLSNKDYSVAMAELEGVKETLAVVQTELNTKMEELSAVVAEMASVKEEKATLETALVEALEKLAGAEEYTKQLAEKAVEEKLAARKEKLVATIGEARADATFEAVKGIDDAAFETVVSAFAMSLEVEANSPAFKETGATVDVEASSIVVESEESKILKAKYAKK